MRMVIVESPYAGHGWWLLALWRRWMNIRYARACLADCLRRGEAPFASHLLYTQPGVLDDGNTVERRQGILAGLEVGLRADRTVVYTDLGLSGGMRQGIAAANDADRPVEYRTLLGWAP
jgi:hypothetical protein